MPTIKIALFIKAPPETCFDLARNIELHMESTLQTREKAIAGRATGMMELGERVTWEAIHFGIKQKLTAEISELNRPIRFIYTSPLGIIGNIADVLFLTAYMRNFLLKRNLYIKKCAEREAAEV